MVFVMDILWHSTVQQVQQQNTSQIQIKGAILPDDAPPGLIVAANVSFEVTEEKGISRSNTLQYSL